MAIRISLFKSALAFLALAYAQQKHMKTELDESTMSTYFRYLSFEVNNDCNNFVNQILCFELPDSKQVGAGLVANSYSFTFMTKHFMKMTMVCLLEKAMRTKLRPMEY